MERIRSALRQARLLLEGGNRLQGCDDEHVARAFHLLLTVFLVWVGIFVVLVVPLFVVRKVAVAGMLLVVGGTALAALILLRRGHKRAAATLFLSVLWCVASGYSLLSGGIRSPGAFVTIVIILDAAWLLSYFPALGFAAATLLFSFIEAFLAQVGYPLPRYFPGPPLVLWALHVGILVLAVGPVLAFQENLQRQVSSLRESEERFRSLTNASLEGIMIHDRGVILDTNLAFARLFGYAQPEELIGKNGPELLLASESRVRVLQRMERQESGVIEVTGVRKNGGTFTAETESQPIKYLGRDARLVACRDITEHKRAVDALHESEERYKALFDRSLDCAFLTDFEGRFLDANQAALDLLGYRREDIPTLTFASLLTEDQVPLALRMVEQIRTIGYQQNRTEYRLRRKGEGQVVVETQSSLIYHEGKPFAIQGIARDITEQKQVEEDLRQSEQRFRALAAATFEGIVITEGGRITDVNEQLAGILGYERQEMIGREIVSFLLPEERDLVLSNIRQGMESQIEHRLLRKDGGLVDVEAHGQTTMYQNRPVRFTAIRDITQRKRAEEALQQSEERFRKAFRSNPLPMAIAKIDGGIVDVNDILLQKLGLKLEEVVSRTADELGISIEPAAKIREEFRNAGFKIQERETQYRTRSGKVLTFLLSIELIQVGGESHGLWMGRDITEQKQQEDFMRMLGSAVANAADAILIVDADLTPTPTIVYANPAFTRLTGYTPEELVGQRTGIALGTYRSAPKTIEEINQVLLAGKEYHGEVINYSKDGRLLYLELDIVPVRDSTGKATHYVSVRRDISRRKKEELDRKQLLRLVLEAQTEERRRISRELHDQAGQLLTSMLLRLSALQESTSDQSVKEAVQEISSTASSTLEDISRIARGLHPAVLEDLGLIEALRRAMQEFDAGGISATLRTRGIKQRLPQQMEYEVYQIIKEALTNVRKHSHADSVVLSFEGHTGSITASIKDNGVGFDLLGPAAGRTRLGIVGMNERAALLGGSVLVDSAPGKGTVVTLTIPLSEPQVGGGVNEP